MDLYSSLLEIHELVEIHVFELVEIHVFELVVGYMCGIVD